MRDSFFQSLAFERVDLVARLVAGAPVRPGDHELAIAWIAEMTTAIVEGQKNAGERPQNGGVESGGGALLQ
ncbi:hypothetical protein [Gibbsiella quercinecans]|uniref:hypothetical protein n=1 Tax=Gibbsiella quercinecans TaxID=929813 RepID=UPI00242E15E2|nr:hypothetical protein [Gibbsiella quercinecans]